MSNVIQATFGVDREDPDQLYHELEPIINELVETACSRLGEEEGCLLVKAVATTLTRLAEMLDDQVETADEVSLTLEDGSEIQVELEGKQ